MGRHMHSSLRRAIIVARLTARRAARRSRAALQRLRPIAAGTARLARAGAGKAAHFYKLARENPVVRERIAATSAFAFIFGFLVWSVDFLVTGGPEWNPGAQAAELQAAYVQVEGPAPAFADAAPPPMQFEPIALEPDYSISADSLLGGPDVVLTGWRHERVRAEAEVRRAIDDLYQQDVRETAPEKPAYRVSEVAYVVASVDDKVAED